MACGCPWAGARLGFCLSIGLRASSMEAASVCLSAFFLSCDGALGWGCWAVPLEGCV